MRTRSRVMVVLVLACLLGAPALLQSQSAAVLFEQALLKENAEGSLNQAIAIFSRIAADKTVDPTIRAKAQLHVGICHEKLGDAQARHAYERLIADFPQQTTEVAAARARLAALAGGASALAQGRATMGVRKVLQIETGTEAAIDRRATFFSYTDWETGDLAIRELPGGDKRRLTNKGPWSASSEFTQVSVPSPDGGRVAYDWWTERGPFELRIIALDGSAPRTIHDGRDTSEVYPTDWSPDGSWVLAVLVLRDEPACQLALLSIGGGSRRVITSVPRPCGAERARFSPDGRYVAFDHEAQPGPGQHDIFVVARDGSRPTPLVRHTADDLLLGWSPDGRFLLFSSDRTGTTDAWLLPIAEGQPLGGPQLVMKNLGRVSPMGFGRDGRFYYGLGTGGQDVYVASVDPASGKVLASPRVVPERVVGSNLAPEWSPDGRSLLWLSPRRTGGGYVLTIRTLSTGEERQLNTELVFQSVVRWSTDGRWLFGRCLTGGKWGICRADAQTGAAAMLVEKNGWAAGMPDATHLIYGLAPGPNEKQGTLVIRDLVSGEERQIVRTSSSRSVLSPDGRRLAFEEINDTTKERVVKIVALAGGEPREVFRSTASMSLSWTGDGRYVLGGESDPDSEILWLLPVDGAKPLRFTVGRKGVFGPRLHPDGRQLAFYTRAQADGEVWVMENFLPAAKEPPAAPAEGVKK